MRILHVSRRSDIRAFKQAAVMLNRGHEVDIAVPMAQIFGFTPADDLPDLEIENLPR